jgi:hypothetical protein
VDSSANRIDLTRDEVDPDAARMSEILDATPGAWQRTQAGLAQAARSEGVPLEELSSADTAK